MRRHDVVVGLGHGRDFLHLQNAAAQADFGLDDVERLGLEDALKLELRVIARATGQWDRGRAANP